MTRNDSGSQTGEDEEGNRSGGVLFWGGGGGIDGPARTREIMSDQRRNPGDNNTEERASNTSDRDQGQARIVAPP